MDESPPAKSTVPPLTPILPSRIVQLPSRRPSASRGSCTRTAADGQTKDAPGPLASTSAARWSGGPEAFAENVSEPSAAPPSR